MKQLSEKIIDFRNQAEMTQQDLAENLNVTPQAVSKWENDKSIPDILILIRLSDLMNCSLDSLIKEDTYTQKSLSIKTKLDTVINFTPILIACVILLISTLDFTNRGLHNMISFSSMCAYIAYNLVFIFFSKWIWEMKVISNKFIKIIMLILIGSFFFMTRLRVIDIFEWLIYYVY